MVICLTRLPITVATGYFIFASLIAIPASSYAVIAGSVCLKHIIISIVTLIAGCIIAYKLGEK